MCIRDSQNIVRLEVDDGNGIQVIDIDSGKPFAIVLPLKMCIRDRYEIEPGR